MATKRETALAALLAALGTLTGSEVKRNAPEADDVPEGGSVILRDGDPGAPEVYLSPPAYGWTHRAEVVVQVQAHTSAARDLRLDALLEEIAAAIDADPTLGGAVEQASVEAPEILTEAVENGAAIKAALLPVTLEYLSNSPLG